MCNINYKFSFFSFFFFLTKLHFIVHGWVFIYDTNLIPVAFNNRQGSRHLQGSKKFGRWKVNIGNPNVPTRCCSACLSSNCSSQYLFYVKQSPFSPLQNEDSRTFRHRNLCKIGGCQFKLKYHGRKVRDQIVQSTGMIPYPWEKTCNKIYWAD